jgi:hypothetical protein
MDRGQGWRLTFEREPGPAPEKISLPASLGSRFHFTQTEGVQSHFDDGLVLIDTKASRWTAFWKA